jgi:hypothetical protein
MKDEPKSSLILRLIFAPFKIVIFTLCIVVAVYLEFAGEKIRAIQLMNWANRFTA